MVKLRKRVKLAFIEDKAARKITFKKRRKGLLKKTDELSTLCDVKTCAIIYGPYEEGPGIWPPRKSLKDLITKFKMLPEMNQTKRQVNLYDLMFRRFKKCEERLVKLTAEKRELEMNELMSDFTMGNDMSQRTYSLQDLVDFELYLEKTVEDCDRMIKNHPKGASSASSSSSSSNDAALAEVEAGVAATAAGPVSFDQRIRQDQIVGQQGQVPDSMAAVVPGPVAIQFHDQNLNMNQKKLDEVQLPVTTKAPALSLVETDVSKANGYTHLAQVQHPGSTASPVLASMAGAVSEAFPIGLYGLTHQHQNMNLNQDQAQHGQYPATTMTPATALTMTIVPEVVPMLFYDQYLNPNSYQNQLAQIHLFPNMNLNQNQNQAQYVQFPVTTTTPATTITTATVSQAIPTWFYDQTQQYLNRNVHQNQLAQANHCPNVNLNQNQQAQTHQYSNVNLNPNQFAQVQFPITTTTSPPAIMANTSSGAVPIRFNDQNLNLHLDLNQNQIAKHYHPPNMILNQNQLGQVQYPITNTNHFPGLMPYAYPGHFPIGFHDHLQQYPVTTTTSNLSPMATHASVETTPLSFRDQLPQSMNMDQNGKQMEHAQCSVATMSPALASSSMAAATFEASSVRFPYQINQNQNQLENVDESPITPLAPNQTPSPMDFYDQFQQGNEDENSNQDFDQTHDEWVREMLKGPPEMESNEELMRFLSMEDNKQNQVNNHLPAARAGDNTHQVSSIASSSADDCP